MARNRNRPRPQAARPQRRAQGRRVTLTRPPPGTYDPSLDVQERAATRGLGDLLEDVSRTGGYETTDFQLLMQDLARQRGEFEQDVATERTGVERSYRQSLADLLTERTQAGEDYSRSIGELQRGYQLLGNRQAQLQRAAGLRGGAVAQAAAKRAANEVRERQPVDVGYRRFRQASGLSEQRLGEQRQLSLDELLRQQQRGVAELERTGGQAGLTFQRGAQERAVQQARGGREYQAYLQDLAAARQAQYGGPLVTVRPRRPGQQPQPRRRRRTIGTAGRPRAGLGGY